MAALIFFFVLSILFSFLCSIWEAVLLSITPSYVQGTVQAGGAVGKRLQTFKNDIDRPLSAILTLNTIAYTVGAIGVGAQAGALFGEHGLQVLGIEITWESVIAAAMTLAILVLSEIIPKTIGANNWRTLAPFTVRSLGVLLVVLAPFVWLSQLITRTLKKNKQGSVLSRSDFAAMARAGATSGVLDEGEHRVIRNLLNMEAIEARNVMTPRTVLFAVAADLTLQTLYAEHGMPPFSRIPVYDGAPDHITGILLKDEWLEALVNDEGSTPAGELARSVPMLSHRTPLPDLFEALTEERAHMAVLVDEFGAVQGVVTQEDIFETLLGREIVDESDSVDDLQQRARDQWRERAERLNLIEPNPDNT